VGPPSHAVPVSRVCSEVRHERPDESAKLASRLPWAFPIDAGMLMDHRNRAHPSHPKAYGDASITRRTYLPSEVRLRGANSLLRLAASRHLRLVEVAALFHVSPNHLLKIFRDAGQPSPMRQVRQITLAPVVQRLRSTRASVESIADEFGYADGSSLRRALWRAFGRTCSDLRHGSDTRDRAKVTISVLDKKRRYH
jgi:AraC-like DNA-binding protein